MSDRKTSGHFPLVVSVVGRHKVGKTTVVTRMVEEWTHQGLRVAVLKHDGHADVDLSDDWEKPGSDTRRVVEAGASMTMVVGGGQTLLRTVHDEAASDVDALITRMATQSRSLDRPLDIIVVEGFKSSDLPKVVVATPDNGESLVSTLSNVCAVVKSPLFEWQSCDGEVVPFTEKHLAVYHEDNLQELCNCLWQQHFE